MAATEGTAPQRQDDVAEQLLAVRNAMRSPSGLGEALVDFALTNASRFGTFQDDHFDIPAVYSITPVELDLDFTPAEFESETNDPMVCHEHSVSVFGVSVYSWVRCHTEPVHHHQELLHPRHHHPHH